MRRSTKVVLLLALQLVCISVLSVHAESRVSALQEKRTIAEALELSDLVIATDCYSTRNPSLVDFSGCFRDMPTQLCYHASCTGLAPPKFAGFNTRLEVER